MPHSLIGPVTEPDGSGGERIEAADLQAAIRIATERAFEMMAADLADGGLRPEACIFIQDDQGETVHVVRFRDLIDNPGPWSS